MEVFNTEYHPNDRVCIKYLPLYIEELDIPPNLPLRVRAVIRMPFCLLDENLGGDGEPTFFNKTYYEEDMSLETLFVEVPFKGATITVNILAEDVELYTGD